MSSPEPAVSRSGDGVFTLSGDNTYQGGTIVSDAILKVPDDEALGEAGTSVSLNASTLQFGGGTTSRDFIIGPGGATISAGDPDIPMAGNETTISGVISGDGPVTFTGFGGITLTGDNTYTGGTTIAEGAIVVGNGGTTGSIVGNVDVGSSSRHRFLPF